MNGSNQAGKTFTYSPDGNLKEKRLTSGGTNGSPGTITYGSAGRPNGAGPHAVSSTSVGPAGALRTFVYDANGNFTGYTDNSRTLTRILGNL